MLPEPIQPILEDLVFRHQVTPTDPNSGDIHPCSISPIRRYPPEKTAVFPNVSKIFKNVPIKCKINHSVLINKYVKVSI